MKCGMTIPIQDGIKAVRLHIAMCDAATPGPWEEVGRTIDGPHGSDVLPSDVRCSRYCQGGTAEGMKPADVAFVVAARAGYKASLEFLLWWCGMYVDHASIKSDHPLGLAVLPLIAHLDATRPNWRTNEPV